MLKRSVVLGGLIAGAFLLPSVASAGKVTGVCSTCHTMHASQNGVAGTPHNTLLVGTGCTSCHADPAYDNDSSGKSTATPFAPQVDNHVSSPAGFINNAGYFDSTAGNSTHQHNVVGATNYADTVITGGVAPGGTFPIGSGSNPVLTCGDCHGGSGGHHGSTNSSYRLLSGTNTTISTQTDYGAVAAGPTVACGTRSEVAYNATDMNAFCARCHGTFHQSSNPTTAAGNQRSSTSGTWLRHPTDISMAAQKTLGATITPSLQESNFSLTGNDRVVVGTIGANGSGVTDGLMCLSCHVAHGGPYDDLLSFDYTAQTAGGATPARNLAGCEACHSYGAGAGVGM